MRISRTTIFMLVLSLMASTIFAQARMEWEFVEHDYGSISEGTDGLVEFAVKNVGDEDLYITDYESKCGCLKIAGYTQVAIEPGKKGFVHLKYDTYILGRFTKYVVITTNAGSRRLKVYGAVIENF